MSRLYYNISILREGKPFRDAALLSPNEAKALIDRAMNYIGNTTMQISIHVRREP